MADTEEPQFTTLKERIAALNQQKNFSSSSPSPGKPAAPSPARPAQKTPVIPPSGTTPSNGAATVRHDDDTPPPPSRPSMPQRPSSKPAPPPLPRRDTQTSLNSNVSQTDRAPPPPLPSRTNTTTPVSTPPLLPRRTTQQTMSNGRRGSASSEVSQASTLSQTQTLSSATSHGSDGRRLPPAFNQASLPALPPTRREREEATAAKEAAAQQQRVVPQTPADRAVPSAKSTAAAAATATLPAKPSLPPRLPGRPSVQKASSSSTTDATPAQHPTLPQRPATGLGTTKIQGFSSGKPSPTPQAQPEQRPADDAPPPIPVSTRPSVSQIDATNSRFRAQAEAQDECWVCKDWSGPDGVAAQFPRQSLPRNDPVGHLAHGLCSPFPSYTDKARAIFTWFHHNIHYDTVSFFGNCVKHMSVEDTIFSGKAVCQGYAETYAAIAKRAGLDCVVVTGHGKGYGYNKLKKGESPPPPKPDGHAWNAVRIDGGVWKLLDACWGAGHLDSGSGEYKQEFSPKQFIRTNEEFGEFHFPKESRYQFRNDGRVVSWDEYYIGRLQGEQPVLYSTARKEGILDRSVQPMERDIPVYSGEVVRFQFSKICKHWRSETHGPGKPPLLLLSIHGLDGRNDEMVPMETDGYWHWIDVQARDLGAPGQSVQVAQITSIDGQDARGVSAQEYLSKKGRVGMGWTYILKWELV